MATILESRKPKLLWTIEGVAAFGKLMEKSRHANGWAFRKMEEIIYERSGCKVSYKTLEGIEKGHRMPQWNTMVAIAEAQVVCDPYTKQPLTMQQCCLILSESWYPSRAKLNRKSVASTKQIKLRTMDRQSLRERIRQWIEKTGTTEEDFEALALHHTLEFSWQRLQEIMAGEDLPTDEELDAIGSILGLELEKDSGDLEEMFGVKKSPVPEQQGCHTLPGNEN